MRELERHEDQPHESPALAIVGAGRVGHAIAGAAAAAGLRVAIADRESLAEACEEAEAVLLCVPDAAIAEAAASASASARRLRFLGHTSGATGLEALAEVAGAGLAAFSIHPLQTIPDGDAELGGVAAAISGTDERALGFARELALALGMRPFEVPEDQRAAYHAAASIASNFLVTLEESAVELLRRAGVEDPRELLAPLVLRTVANWSERGPAALTGPIARGDEATVARHLEALAESDPELLDLYRALEARTRALAQQEAAT
jgi:predicted short-subunit dehydrogenase-like oxidoreductase (DUF2520 family)